MYLYIIYIDVKFDEVGIVDSLYDCALQNHLSRDICFILYNWFLTILSW